MYPKEESDDLIRRLKLREGKARVELSQKFGTLAAVIINRLNESWITPRITLDGVEKVMKVVSETIADTEYQQLHTISLRKLVEETAQLVGIAIWRRFNT
jgi:hypothetical protein